MKPIFGSGGRGGGGGALRGHITSEVIYIFWSVAEMPEAYSEPYLRVSWMLGWLAICPTHINSDSRCSYVQGQCAAAPLDQADGFHAGIFMRFGGRPLDLLYDPRTRGRSVAAHARG